MKKILGILSIFALCVFTSTVAHAQVKNFTSSYGLTSDTVTNTATDTLMVTAGFNYNFVEVQVTVIKISGTVAGNATLWGSNNNLSWYQIPQWDNLTLSAGAQDSLKCTNVYRNNKIWLFHGSRYVYYKIKYTGVGTMSAKLFATLNQR